METNTTNKLISILKNKGITFEKGEQALFKKYSYFQVVNAYKNLFISDEDDIDEIKDNIANNIKIEFYRSSFGIKPDVKDDELYDAICNKITKKYGIVSDPQMTTEELIKKIKYHHHIYNTGVTYGDFVRMYKFEHELRSMLLKYTLIIEETVKNIFISYLNDKNADPNYLINMDNYNTKSLKSKPFDTMKLIIDKYDNRKSKPIDRKRTQNLPVPYWMIINELAMNQTYYAIANLNEVDSNEIFLRCMNYFTRLNVTSETRGKNPNQVKNEKKLLNNFKTVLNYLGEFRNMLAHNQPIYCYNVESFRILQTEELKYILPTTQKDRKDKYGNLISPEQQQLNLNGTFMNCLQSYFGIDSFNKNNSTKLDLSKIIYILYKILKTIDNNTEFYNELIHIYKKYNIILKERKIEINNPQQIEQLKNSLEMLFLYDSGLSENLSKIKNKEAYIMSMKAKDKELKDIVKDIKRISKTIDTKEINSKYKTFNMCKRYYDFTGINAAFFKNIL